MRVNGFYSTQINVSEQTGVKNQLVGTSAGFDTEAAAADSYDKQAEVDIYFYM